MNQRLSVESMRVIADIVGLSFAKKRFQRGDDNALENVADTASRLEQDLAGLKAGQLTEVLEDTKLRGDTALRNIILDILNARKKDPTAP